MDIKDNYSGLGELVTALSMAVETRLMSAEHASSVWKEQLRVAGIDSPKKTFPKPEEKVEEKAAV